MTWVELGPPLIAQYGPDLLDLAVQPRCSQLDVGVGNALVQHVPVELRLDAAPLSVWITSTSNGSLDST
ncbi:hypothetical protein [Actinomadura violacea]|uniref:Uncharacterized protein n=1 Tax=Actinomadura violacea TaxID=2819934 RepID=A0ABS3RN69_9ACTN|nr:hypothetical protein [Actinomadura violacea]MBO2458205.1 hypothetical protein [Actinomadura violacea]